MKKRDLFLDRILINETLYVQVDRDTLEYVNFYVDNNLIEQFSLKKRIFTFFKTIQKYTDDDEYIIDSIKNIKLYGKEIVIKNNLFMKVKDINDDIYVQFYQKENEIETEIYSTRMIYTTQKLFSLMVLPIDFKLPLINPLDYKDIIDILSVVKL